MWNWSLFLAHTTWWHERLTSENTQDTSWCLFWVFEVSCKIRVLKHSAWLCCVSHITIMHCNHTCDECKRSNAPNVGSQTISHQVYQYVPKKDISRQCVSIHWTILPLIHFLLFWIDDHPCMVLRPCIIARLFYSQVRNIFPHISLRDLPCHSTKKMLFLHQVSLKLWSVVFLWLQQKSWIRTYPRSLSQCHY